MTVQKIEVGGEVVEFDDAAPLTFGDVFAVREACEATGIPADRIREAYASGDRDLQGQALLMFAFLASVRKDHTLTWREFIWRTPIDSVRPVVDEEAPRPRTEVKNPASADDPLVDDLAVKVAEVLRAKAT